MRVIFLLLGLSIAARSWSAPILVEVFYDAAGTDGAEVFTEILGDPGSSLDGWSLVGINGDTGSPYRTIDLTGAVVPSDGILVLATASAVGELLAVRDFIAAVDWQNGPDAVQLWNALGEIVDALQYGDAGSFNSGEGRPAPDADAGFSLTRVGPDTDDNARDFIAAAPSPGRLVTSRVPEPSSMALLATGLLAAAFRRAYGW